MDGGGGYGRGRLMNRGCAMVDGAPPPIPPPAAAARDSVVHRPRAHGGWPRLCPRARAPTARRATGRWSPGAARRSRMRRGVCRRPPRPPSCADRPVMRARRPARRAPVGARPGRGMRPPPPWTDRPLWPTMGRGRPHRPPVVPPAGGCAVPAGWWLGCGGRIGHHRARRALPLRNGRWGCGDTGGELANKKGAGRFGTRPLPTKKRALHPAAQAHGLGHALDGDQVGRGAGFHARAWWPCRARRGRRRSSCGPAARGPCPRPSNIGRHSAPSRSRRPSRRRRYRGSRG